MHFNTVAYGGVEKEDYSFSFSAETGELYSRSVPKLAPEYIEMSRNEFIYFSQTDHMVSS